MLSFNIEIILFIGEKFCGCMFFSKYLLSDILNVSNNYLYIFFNYRINFLLYIKYVYFLNKKLLNWPLSYFFKNDYFYKTEILFDVGVLIPRYEIYIFIDKLINVIYKYEIKNILELGIGSGAISLILSMCKKLNIIGVDFDLNSFFFSNKNLYNLKILNIEFYYNNWDIFYCNKFKFDIIFSNPPYICFESFVFLTDNLVPFESKKSLLSDNFGFNSIIFIIKMSYIFLNKKGILIIEHGYRQSFMIRKIFFYFGYFNVNTYIDKNYFDRITIGVKY
ncbi:MAG TPA: HemK family protein methyltransferase [Candidatus Azosocius sp. HAIN]